jgi:heptosyltransferase II
MRVLAVTPNWLGDMVMAASLFQGLKTANPETKITALGPAFAQPLLARLEAVDQVIESPFGHGGLELSARRNFARQLPQFDAALVLPNSWKSALIPAMAGIPKRVGWRGEARWGLLTHHQRLDKTQYPRMVDRYTALAQHFNIQPASPNPVLTSNPINFEWRSQRPLLVIAPGAAFGSAKRWPADRFAQVALSALSRGFEVALVGGPAEKADCQKIADAQPAAYQSHIHSLAGDMPLGESIDLMAQATQVVANDSGLMHVAAALGVPVIGLFGPTSPEHTPPLSESAQVVWSRPECAPCFKKQCPLSHHACMHELLPEQVVEKLA